MLRIAPFLLFAALAGCDGTAAIGTSQEAETLAAEAESPTSGYSADCKSLDPKSDATVTIHRLTASRYGGHVTQTQPVKVDRTFWHLSNMWSGDFDNFTSQDGLFHVLVGPQQSPANVEYYGDAQHTRVFIDLEPGLLGCTFQGTTQH
jgi:hypothetical protein